MGIHCIFINSSIFSNRNKTFKLPNSMCFLLNSFEVHSIRVTNYLSAISETISRHGNQICLYAIILAFTLDDKQFRASEIYITVWIVNALSVNVLLMLSLGVRHTIQMAVTVKRIQVLFSFIGSFAW